MHVFGGMSVSVIALRLRLSLRPKAKRMPNKPSAPKAKVNVMTAAPLPTYYVRSLSYPFLMAAN